MWIHLLPLGLIDGAGSATVIPPAASATLGAPHRKLPLRYSAEIDGKIVYFDDPAELQALLDSYVVAKKKKLKKHAVTKIQKPVDTALPYIVPPVQMPMWAVQQIQQTNASLEAYFWGEFARLLNNDDEEALIALL